MQVRGTTDEINAIIAWLETNVGPRIRWPNDHIVLKGQGWTMTRNFQSYRITRISRIRHAMIYAYEVDLDHPEHEVLFAMRWS